MTRIVLSRRALLDLEEIEEYSREQWGSRVAKDYLWHIEEALNLLKQYPHLLKSQKDFSEHLQFYRSGRHFLVCTTFKECIFVLTIKHGAMDLPPRLAELEPSLAEEVAILQAAMERDQDTD